MNTRPTHAIVNLLKLDQNIHHIRQAAQCKILACIKANAYGHGLIPIATRLEPQVDYLGVAFLEEGKALRKAGIRIPILVLGGIIDYQIQEFLHHRLEFTASSLYKVREINKVAGQLGHKADVHLKIDTGMERIGVHDYNALPFVEESVSLPHVHVKGIYSHFATADELDKTFARRQLELFLSLLQQLEQRGIRIPIRHIANSAAVLDMPESYLDMIRPGIMMYGIPPSRYVSQSIPLQPILSLHSKVVYFKVTKKGHGISYGHQYTPLHDTRIVTIPVGYGDGFSRLLSNKAKVKINNAFYPVVGAICMDQTMVDIGPSGQAYNGDDVEIYGDGEENSVVKAAELTGTIPYEILCMINTRVPRLYVE